MALEDVNYSPEELAALGEAPIESETEEVEEIEETGAEEEASDAETQSEEDGEQPGSESKTVPLSALHEERAKRKERDAELQELKTKVEVLDRVQQRFEQFQQAQPQVPQVREDPEVIPDKNEDPFGYIDYMDKKLDKLEQGFNQTREQSQHQSQLAEFKRTIQWEEQQFIQNEPDYPNAAKHVGQVIQNNLIARGYQGPHLAQKYEQELLSIALDAKETGRTVPEVINALAKNWGYSKAAPATTPEEQTNDAQQTLEKIAAGQKASKEVSSSGAPQGKMTLEKLGSLSQSEFDKWAEKNPKALEALFGG